ncbi:MAG: peptidylprolyl isomerase [Planctomycetes bacterium]|nr:peptidylprolyl isomerase [Planctomycetota bacterium]
MLVRCFVMPIAVSLVFVAGCKSKMPDAPGRMGAQIAPVQPLPQDPLETIARYEDARTDGDGLLQALLQKGSTETRVRAATALGRLDASDFGVTVTHALAAALDDDSADVRTAAAFALGQRRDATATKALLAHWRDSAPSVRERIVEAASKIDDARLRTQILASFDDPDPRVCSAAALAPMRFAPKLADAAVADAALIEFLMRDEKSAKSAPDAEARWRGLFALARRKSERARALFTARASSGDVRERMYAAQGLGGAGYDDAGRNALVTLIADNDWRVACEAALALGKQPNAESYAALVGATKHPSAHVRRCAFEALGSFKLAAEDARPVFEHARSDISPNVRAAAIEAGAKLYGDESAPHLALAASDKDPLVRAGAAAGAAYLTAPLAVPMLRGMTTDADLRVAGIAIAGLVRHPVPESRARLHELLSAKDNGLRLAAVTSLREMPSTADLAPLHVCLETTRGEIAAEVAAGIMETAAKIGGDQALDILKAGMRDADAFVRKQARRLAQEKFPGADLPREDGKSARIAAVPIPGKDAPLYTVNPRVEVRTSRGTMQFELFPNEAPAHVFNFLALVERNHYDGLMFHRVAPNFVIQGGDTRGDGNGGVTWRGEPLRAEFTPRAYVRGSLGMPRNDDPDSGGSQFFVTHRETPHLDGRYTIFGELRAGFDVLDAIEVGDRIESIRLLNAR